MSFGARTGILTAGGHAVHRLAPVKRPQGPTEEKGELDREAPIERYQEMAGWIHRPHMVRLRAGYLIGCSCGWTESVGEIGAGRATMLKGAHILDEADKLMAVYELSPEEPNNA